MTVAPLPPCRLRRHAELERLRLFARIHRSYETVTATRSVGDLQFPFTRIKDPDRVLDQVVEECDRLERQTGVRLQDPQHLPYWAELWESSQGVAETLATLDLSGRSVLDLGCGMGLTGTVAAARGANVLFADLEPPALLFARLNSLHWQRPVRTRQLNWQRDRLGETFDPIIGADILYERSQWEFLDAFWRLHLAPGGTLYLGEPGRLTGDTFLEWAPQRGWSVDRQDRVVAGRDAPVRVLTLRRRDR